MQKANSKQTEKPLYLGHRARLRSVFLVNNGATMPDYELLELLLTFSIPRRDVKPLAKHLIAKFDDINGVINAPMSELLSLTGVSKNTAALIKIVQLCKQNLSSSNLSSRNENSFIFWGDFITFCGKKIKDISPDEIAVFFLDDSICLLDEKRYKINKDNTINKQELTCDIILSKATQIVLAHKHYDGNKKPTDADIKLTENICNSASFLDINTIDHLIFSADGFCSMFKSGLMPSAGISKKLRHSKILADYQKISDKV